MRLDHIAYRVKDRKEAAKFFIEAFGYQIDERVPDGFEIEFDNKSKAKCLVLIPPEHLINDLPFDHLRIMDDNISANYHMAPEIFISDGTEGSVINEWVEARNNIGGIHHLAYQVDSVAHIMKEWRQNGWAEFTTEKPIKCPGLIQVFTKPMQLTGGIIYEFIEREDQGFCKENVKSLMESTKNFSNR